MLKVTRIFFLLALLFGCQKRHEPKDPVIDERALIELKPLYEQKLLDAQTMRDQDGWLDHGCDAALYTGKYGASWGVSGVNYAAAEYPDEPGRFHRRPISNPCWTEELGDVGSKTTWSRDMGLGLLLFAWRTKDLALVERHTAYGRAHPAIDDGLPAWQMGAPLADGRVIYTPTMIGLAYQIELALGGKPYPERGWPGTYPEGLVDYQAHLQAIDILLRGEIEGVTDLMLKRAEEHAAREPNDPFFAYLAGLYSGDLTHALDVCLDPTMPLGTYSRCEPGDQVCKLPHWLFACGNVLHSFGGI